MLDSMPWWGVSLISSLSAMALLALAMLSPSPYGWLFVLVGVAVFLLALRRNPAYWYRRSAESLLAFWAIAVGMVGFSGTVYLPNHTVAELVVDAVGAPFHGAICVVFVALVFADCRTNAGRTRQSTPRRDDLNTDNDLREAALTIALTDVPDVRLRSTLFHHPATCPNTIEYEVKWTARVQALTVFLLRCAAGEFRTLGKDSICIEGPIAQSLKGIGSVKWAQEMFGRSAASDKPFVNDLFEFGGSGSDTWIKLRRGRDGKLLLRPERILVTFADNPASPMQIAEFAQSVEEAFLRIRRRKQNARRDEFDSGGGGVAVSTRNAQIDIKIDADFDKFSPDQEERVLRGIQEFLKTNSSVRVSKKWRGCVGMRLSELSHEQAERLEWAAKAGDLEGLMIVDAKCVSDEDHDEKWLDEEVDCVAASNPLRLPRPARSSPPTLYFRFKRIVDVLSVTVMLLPGLPLIGLLCLLVRLTSHGPAIYQQRRVGKNGTVFSLYKIRTMREAAEDASGPMWASTGDPRITRVGRFLRKLHLDELPQLFNVLRGDMSLIGPRPERPELVSTLPRHIPNYLDRNVVLPGITGLAQVNVAPDTDLESTQLKLTLDLEYIRTASLWLDVRILTATLLAGFSSLPISMARRITHVKREPRDISPMTVTPFDIHGDGNDLPNVNHGSDKPKPRPQPR